MFLDLSDLFRGEGAVLHLERHIDTGKDSEREDDRFVHGIDCVADIANKAGIVTLSAIAVYDYRAPCDRCAEETTRRFTLPVVHTLVTQLNDEDNDDYIVLENGQLDLDGLIYEDVLLELPMRFLCKEDCKGLCVMCGRNLNLGSCGCKKPVDPRLDVLSGLLEENDNE